MISIRALQITQMNWRLKEGSGEAVYRIGVTDSGHPEGYVWPFGFSISCEVPRADVSRDFTAIQATRYGYR